MNKENQKPTTEASDAALTASPGSEYEVWGHALVPCQIKMRVFAADEMEAMYKAKSQTRITEDSAMHYGCDPDSKKLKDSVVPNSTDESCVFGFEPLGANLIQNTEDRRASQTND